MRVMVVVLSKSLSCLFIQAFLYVCRGRGYNNGEVNSDSIVGGLNREVVSLGRSIVIAL